MVCFKVSKHVCSRDEIEMSKKHFFSLPRCLFVSIQSCVFHLLYRIGVSYDNLSILCEYDVFLRAGVFFFSRFLNFGLIQTCCKMDS